MANINTPFGFSQRNAGSALTPSFGFSRYRIAAGNTAAIYRNDPVMPVIGTANGYITAYVPGTTRLTGIFVGCKYLSLSQKRVTWSPYWPGTDASGDVEAYVVDDPNAQFEVQGDATHFIITGTPGTFGSSVIGQLASVSMGTGNAVTGQSGAFLSGVGTTATFPFKVIDLVIAPPGAPGADPTTGFNRVIVGFNNVDSRANSAVTGIA